MEIKEEKKVIEKSQQVLMDIGILDAKSSNQMMDLGPAPHASTTTSEQQQMLVVGDGREAQIKMDVVFEFGTDVMDNISNTTSNTTSITLPTTNTVENIIKSENTNQNTNQDQNGDTLHLPATQLIANKESSFLGPEWATKFRTVDPLPPPSEATQRRIDAKKRQAAVLHETHMKQTSYRENIRKGLGADGRQLDISSLSRLASMAATYLHLTGRFDVH